MSRAFFTALSSSTTSKEEEAQKIVQQEGINEGLVAVFRNCNLRILLFGPAKGNKQKRSQAAKVSRRLALLHAHKLISLAA
jgi:hypothetical protein